MWKCLVLSRVMKKLSVVWNPIIKIIWNKKYEIQKFIFEMENSTNYEKIQRTVKSKNSKTKWKRFLKKMKFLRKVEKNYLFWLCDMCVHRVVAITLTENKKCTKYNSSKTYHTWSYFSVLWQWKYVRVHSSVEYNDERATRYTHTACTFIVVVFHRQA